MGEFTISIVGLILFFGVVLAMNVLADPFGWSDDVLVRRFQNINGGAHSIAADSQGNIHFAWPEAEPTQISTNVYYAKLGNNGEIIINATKVSNLNFSFWPSIAIDAQNNVHMIWQNSAALVYSKLDDEGNTLVDDIFLTPSLYSFMHSIDIDADGNSHIILSAKWRYGSQSNLYYMKLDNNGTVLINVTDLTRNPQFPPFDLRFPSVSVDQQNKVHVLWLGSDGINYMKLDTFGRVIIPRRVVVYGDYPSLSVDQNGTVHISFEAGPYGQTIYYMKISDNGTNVTSRQVSSSGPAMNPFIVVDRMSYVYIFWPASRGKTRDFDYAKLDPSGRIIINDTRLTFRYHYGSAIPAATVDRQNNIHFTWYGQWFNSAVFYYKRTLPPTPTILVHGIYSNDQIWDQVEAALENEGFLVYRIGEVLNQPGLVPNNGNIIELAGQVKRAIDIVKAQTGASKVNIVSHSMGGLATRFYIRTSYQNDIDKLITLGTPNEGAPIARGQIARFFGNVVGNSSLDLARIQMIPDSTFLQLLNSNFDTRGVNHTEIAGTFLDSIVLLAQPSYAFRITDSIVPRSSVNIPNIACFQNRNAHNDFLLGTAYYEDQIILMAIVNILKGQPITLRSCPTEQLDQPEQGNNVQVRSITNTINPNERQLAIENLSGIRIGGLLQWESGDLYLEFITPSGSIINATTYTQYLNVTYSNESRPEGKFEWIALNEPGVGNYSMRVVAANIPSPQQYTLTVFIETSATLETRADKATYRPNEPAILNTYLTESYQPILNASVTAAVTKPDRSIVQVTLFDDGHHYDRNASDGIYGNFFNETEREGLYLVDVNASITNRFELLDATNFFVELFPDLKVDEADITITPSLLIPGENATVTVQAIIHNIGEKDATNTTIEFYNGDPSMNGIKFGNVTIDVPINQSTVASVSLPVIFVANASLRSEGVSLLNSTTNLTMLDTALQSRNIHAIISPFASYLESNYTNNQAKRPLHYANLTYVLAFSLGTTPGIPLGDGRVIPLNIDPLLLLSIQVPRSLGLENSIGILENGGAHARFTVPYITKLRGLTIYAAFVTIHPQGAQPFVSISNAVPLTFV